MKRLADAVLSIKSVLTLGVASFIGVFIALILSFSGASSDQVINEYVRALMQEKATRINQNVERMLGLAQALAETSATHLAGTMVDGENRDAVERYLFQQLTSLPNVTGIYVGWPSGDFLYVKREEGRRRGSYRTIDIAVEAGERHIGRHWRDGSYGVVEQDSNAHLEFDPRTRPWYRDAADARRTIWVDPYLFNSSRKPGVTVASPALREDGTLHLVVGVDLDIFVLSGFLRDLDLGNSSAAFVAGPDLAVVASTTDDWSRASAHGGDVGLPRLGDLNVPAIRGALDARPATFDLREGDGNVFTAFAVGGADYHAYVKRFVSIDRPWITGLIIPDASYLEQFDRNWRRYLMAAFGVALVVALLTAYTARTIVRPIESLSGIATTLRTQGFGIVPRVSTRYRELNNLAGTFRQLVESLEAKDTRNRTLAEELIALNANLEQQIQSRTDELRQAKEAAERHAREQENFVAVLSHEIKSPLAKIATLAQMVDLTDAALPADTRRRVVNIRQQADNLTAMVNAMLTSIAMARGTVVAQRMAVNVRSLVHAIIEANCPVSDSRRICFDGVPEDLSFPLDADLARLAIGNVLTNALKYSDAGTPITIAAQRSENRLSITIEDRGRGMPDADKPAFGAMFGRGRSAGEVSGMGLGGYIVEMAVLAHGGFVGIESQPGLGTRIALTFT